MSYLGISSKQKQRLSGDIIRTNHLFLLNPASFLHSPASLHSVHLPPSNSSSVSLWLNLFSQQDSRFSCCFVLTRADMKENSDFFHTILSLYLTIQTFILQIWESPKFQDINVQFWLFVSWSCEFISHNSDFFSKNCEIWTCNCEIKSHCLLFYFYSVAETSFHTSKHAVTHIFQWRCSFCLFILQLTR